MRTLKVTGATESLSILNTFTQEELVAALKWLDQIGAIPSKSRTWFIAPSGKTVNDHDFVGAMTTVMHSRRDCEVLTKINDMTFLIEREYKISAPEFGEHRICRNCGADFYDGRTRTTLGGQVCLLHRADIMCNQVIDKNYVKGTENAPQSHGGLVGFVTGRLLMDISEAKIHKALKQAQDWVRQNITEAHKMYPFTCDSIIREITLLGAKAAIRRIAMHDLQKRWETEDTETLKSFEIRSSVMTLLNNWVDTLETLSESAAKLDLLRKSREYRELLKELPVLSEIVTRWGTFAASTATKATKTVFFSMVEQDDVSAVPTNMWKTIARTGVKVRGRGPLSFGELPMLAVEWLDHNVTRVSERHRFLTAEQWETAMSLYDEHREDSTSIYNNPGKAIIAASKL